MNKRNITTLSALTREIFALPIKPFTVEERRQLVDQAAETILNYYNQKPRAGADLLQ